MLDNQLILVKKGGTDGLRIPTVLRLPSILIVISTFSIRVNQHQFSLVEAIAVGGGPAFDRI